MKPIPQISFAAIIGDERVGHKFEVDAIPMAFDQIIVDRYVIALPHVNTIGNLVFCFSICMQFVVLDPGL
jgi:hypothetical protein